MNVEVGDEVYLVTWGFDGELYRKVTIKRKLKSFVEDHTGGKWAYDGLPYPKSMRGFHNRGRKLVWITPESEEMAKRADLRHRLSKMINELSRVPLSSLIKLMGAEGLADLETLVVSLEALVASSKTNA